jgi:anti-sigma B factor antagonist
MEIRESLENGALVLELLGRLDELASTEVEQAFMALLRRGIACVVLDLHGVEYVSSSGLRILLMLSRALKRDGGRLKLCGLSPFVAEVFEVSNFHTVFEVYPTTADAFRALALEQKSA